MSSAIARRLAAEGPKRILALDGGGTRGVVTLCFLEQMQSLLRERYGKPDLVLSDYFDLIGGTSVGSMLATLLALGKDVAYVRARFDAWAPEIFARPGAGLVNAKFDSNVLRGFVETEVHDWPLKSDRLKTGLCIVAKRVDTGSVWAIVNNPAGPFFGGQAADGKSPPRVGNGDYKLADLICASTAAPHYFSPANIAIYKPEGAEGAVSLGHFVDGGVSPHNNPALQLFMMAGITGYNLGGGPIEPRGNRKAWKLGDTNLLVISVGTGTFDSLTQKSRFAALDAVNALQSMISDSHELGLSLLQWMSVPDASWNIDRVQGDLRNDLLGDGAGLKQPLLAFQRYDIRLEHEWLENRDNVGRVFSTEDLSVMRDFTNPSMLAELKSIGTIAASRQVRDVHFPRAFDLDRPAVADAITPARRDVPQSPAILAPVEGEAVWPLARPPITRDERPALQQYDQRSTIMEHAKSRSPEAAIHAVIADSTLEQRLRAYEDADADARAAQNRYKLLGLIALVLMTGATIVSAMALLPVDGVWHLPVVAKNVISGLVFLANGIALYIVSQLNRKNTAIDWMSSRALAERLRGDYFKGMMTTSTPAGSGPQSALSEKLQLFERAHAVYQRSYFESVLRRHGKGGIGRSVPRLLAIISMCVAAIITAVNVFDLWPVDPPQGLSWLSMFEIEPARWQLGFNAVASALMSFASARAMVSQDERNAALFRVTAQKLDDLRSDERLARVSAAAARGDLREVMAYVSDVQAVLDADHEAWLLNRPPADPTAGPPSSYKI